MNQQTHFGILKAAGYLLMACSIFIMLGEFSTSAWTFRAFRDVLKDGLYIFLLGLFFTSTAASSERVRQLQEENAALRAEIHGSGARETAESTPADARRLEG